MFAMAAIETSRLADMIRAASAAFRAVHGSAPLFLVLSVSTLERADPYGDPAKPAPPKTRSFALRRLFSGTHKAFESSLVVDLVVGHDLSKENPEVEIHVLDGARRYDIVASKTPPSPGVGPFEGVVSLRKLDIPALG